MANQWVRLWVDMPNDPKWRTIARISKQPISAVMAVYIHLLASAANSTERGRTQVNDEDMASALDMDVEDVTAIQNAMQGRVLDGEVLSGWDRRQPIREDNSAERSKAWRDKKREELRQTQANASEPQDKDAEEDKDEEIKTLSASGDAGDVDFYETKKKRKLRGEQLESFEMFWDAFSYKSGRAEAADAWIDLKVTAALLPKIIAGAEREAKERQSLVAAGKTPKMGKGWLSGRRWEDQPILPPTGPPSASKFWGASWPGIEERGKQLGLTQGADELPPDFKIRVYEAAKATGEQVCWKENKIRPYVPDD